MSDAITHHLPGEFVLQVINYDDITIRSSLMHYYAVGGNESGDGMFQAKIIRRENGWILLKNVITRFKDINANQSIKDVVGTEDHIWIYDAYVYNHFKCGDCIQFTAKVYAYHRNPEKHNGKESYDFSLKDLDNIRKINGYEFPPSDYKKHNKRRND